MLWTVIGGVLLILAGVVIFLKPEWIWKITEQWKSDYAEELSELYRLSTEIGGVIVALVGIIMVVLPWVLD